MTPIRSSKNVWHIVVSDGCLELVKPDGVVFGSAAINRAGERRLVSLALFDNDADEVNCSYDLKLTQD